MTDGPATGVWFGIDVGTARVGVARTDPRGVLVVPVATLRRDRRTDTDLAHLVELIGDYEAVGVVIGLPRTLAGREGPSAAMARDYGDALAARLDDVPVDYVDERLTTVSAQRKLQQSGRTVRTSRDVVDQAAAVELLEHWLAVRRGGSSPVG